MTDLCAGSSSASSKPDMVKLKNAIHRSLQKGGSGAQYMLREENKSSAQCWESFAHVCHTDGTNVKEFDSGYVACKKCHAVYAYEARHGTSSLNSHKCRLMAADAGAMRLFATTVQPTAFQKRQVARAAANMCCKDLRPFSVVEDPGFRKYSQVILDIGISVGRAMKADDLIPSRFTVKRHVVGNSESLCDVIKAKLKEHFVDKMCAGFTVDLWTDSIKRTSFMSITIHYIDNAFKLHVRTLQVQPLDDEAHTAVRVLKAFKECLHEFGCDDSERCVVCSDSGLNMCGSEGIRSNFKWLSWSDHKIATVLTTVLNKTTTSTNAVKSASFYKFEDAAPEVFELIDSCKDLVRHVKQTSLQRALKNTLKQENVTRWNSLLRMLKSVSKSYEEVSNLLLNRGGNRAILIAKINRELLEELVRFLDRFEEAPLKLESYLRPPLHCVVFERFELLQHCETSTEPVTEVDDSGKKIVTPPDSNPIVGIKKLIKDTLIEKWSLEELHVVAALLDARQKDRLELFDVPFVQVKRGKAQLKTIMQDIATSVDNASDVLEDEVVKERPTKRRRGRPGMCSSDEEDEEAPRRDESMKMSIPERIQKEFEYYFTLKLTKEEKCTFDLLPWWKAKGTAVTTEDLQILRPPLPIMAQAARTVLCVPTSSSKSECNFSDAGNTLTKKRNLLSGSTVNDILFVRSNNDLHSS